tara:strand:- start:98 stop:298 length:201 start_codon:yes stop_codon:yes gene_type:complete
MPDNFIRTSSIDENHLEVDIAKRNMKLLVAITDEGVVVDLYDLKHEENHLTSTWAFTPEENDNETI